MATRTRTDKFFNAMQASSNVSRVTRRDSATGEILFVSFKTHGVFPEESKADYRYARELAKIYGGSKLRGTKDSFERYETLTVTFPREN